MLRCLWFKFICVFLRYSINNARFPIQRQLLLFLLQSGKPGGSFCQFVGSNNPKIKILTAPVARSRLWGVPVIL